MKHKLLIFILFSLSCGIVVAQNESALGFENSYLINSSEYSVVRNWNDEFSISTHSVSGYSHLVKTDFAMVNASIGSLLNYPAVIADSIPNLFIQDMKFVDNYAFIGGYILDSVAPHTYEKRGFLGYYNLSDMYVPNTLNIKLHVYDDFREFFRLVAYYDVSGYKIVALGTYGVISQNPAYIVEDEIMNYTPTITIKEIEFATTSGVPRDIVLDLLLTSDRVVFVGKRNANSSSSYPYYPYHKICVRLADRHNVIGNPMVNTQYIYNSSNEEVNGNIVAACLNDNEFAFAYVYCDPATGEFYTRVRVIDISTMDMISSQEFHTYSKDEPIAMAYDPNNNILTLMHKMPFSYEASYNLTYYVQINPYASSPYAATVLYPSKGLYHTIDMFDKEYYVSTTQNVWYYQHTAAPQPNVNLCPESKEIEISIIPLLNNTQRNDPYTLITTRYLDTRSAVVKQTNISLICSDH